MAELTGRAAVLAELEPTAEPPGGDVEQLDMLGLPQVGVTPEVWSGRGRPPGRRNKRTEAWAEYLLSRYGSPLEVLAQIMTAPAASLARQLGCSAVEALAEKRLAAIALMPYVHQRQPLAVDLTERKTLTLTIVETTESAAESEEVTLTARVIEAQENQGVDDDPSA